MQNCLFMEILTHKYLKWFINQGQKHTWVGNMKMIYLWSGGNKMHIWTAPNAAWQYICIGSIRVIYLWPSPAVLTQIVFISSQTCSHMKPNISWYVTHLFCMPNPACHHTWSSQHPAPFVGPFSSVLYNRPSFYSRVTQHNNGTHPK